MRLPTAAELHEIVRNPNPRRESYEGGFSTADRGVHFLIRFERDEPGTVDLHVQTSSLGFGNTSMYHRLTLEESRELRLALEQAERAAENYERNA